MPAKSADKPKVEAKPKVKPVSRVCFWCDGTGMDGKEACPECKGKGHTFRKVKKGK